jgi:xanthine dehydrogenase small subunit
MRSAISPLTLLRPRSLREALVMLREEQPLMPLAGCTDLYVALNFGTLPGARFLDIWPLASSLGRITTRDGTLSIGALATFTRIARSPQVRRHLPMLQQAARQIGGLQIQNRGTIGGNVANGSPAGDSLPVLAATDAVVVLFSIQGERRVPFTEFYTGYRTSVMRPDELIAALEIPPVDGTQWFRKVGTRAAQAISKVVIAGVRSPTPRIAIGSVAPTVAPTVVRLRETERALAAGATADDAARIAGQEISPIDDLRSTATYRRTVTENLIRRFMIPTGASASERSGGTPEW